MDVVYRIQGLPGAEGPQTAPGPVQCPPPPRLTRPVRPPRPTLDCGQPYDGKCLINMALISAVDELTHIHSGIVVGVPAGIAREEESSEVMGILAYAYTPFSSI